MKAIDPVLLLSEASSGAAVEPALIAIDMGWLQKWAWLMLGLGQDPDRSLPIPDNAPDMLTIGSNLSSRPVEVQSADVLGRGRYAAANADGSAILPDPSVIADLDEFFRQSGGDGEHNGA